jgi:HK97 family phage portal protein
MQVLPWGPWHGTNASAAGVNVSSESAFQLLTVYGCVSLIADTIAALPRDVYRKTNDVPVEVPAPKWLEQPNDRSDFAEFLTQVLVSLLLDGNAYVVWGYDRSFVTNMVDVLDPCNVDVRVDDGQVVYYVNGVPFAGKLKHVKAIIQPGALKGLSPLEAARQSIGLGLAAQEFGGRFYSNGAQMSGVIKTPGEVNATQAREIGEAFARDHAGLANAWKPGVLFGGADWQQISVTPEQAQFLEQRKYQAAEIAAQMFLVDPSLLGIPVAGTSLTYSNLEQRGIHLVQFTLLRWITSGSNG